MSNGLPAKLFKEKFRTYALTVRPRGGITDAQIALLEKFVRDKCEYYHMITEKTGFERHVHAALWLDKPVIRSNVVTMMMRLFKDLDHDEKRVIREGIKIMYNGDWTEKYLNKGDDTVVVCSSLPEGGFIESYFPKKVDPSVSKTPRCSLYYHELERLWYEHTPPGYEVHTMNTRNFLFNVMYNLRILPVIRDDKQIVQVSRHLCRWLNKAKESTIQLPPFDLEE